jgi:amino acid transporter
VSSSAPGPQAPADRRGVRRMLSIFAVLAILGIITLAASVILGLVVLLIAEVFFVIAYRRFSRLARPK